MTNDELEGNTLNVYAYIVHAAKPVGTREVTRGANLSSTSVASRHLQKLEDMGLIERNEYGDYVLKEKTNIKGHVWVGRNLVPRLMFYSFFFLGAFAAEMSIILLSVLINSIVIQVSFYFLTGITGVAMILFLVEGITLYRKLNPKNSESKVTPDFKTIERSMPGLKKSLSFHKRRNLVALSAVLIVLVVLTAFWVLPQILPASSMAVKPSIGSIQPATGYYLTFRGNASKVFVVSVNISAGFYPFDTRTSMGIINGKPSGSIAVTHGEPCVVINVTLRNDYSIQNLPPNQVTRYYNNGTVAPKSAQAYVSMTAELFSGNKEIDSNDLTHLDLPPDAWSETWLNVGDEGTLSIYLAVTSHEKITGFQLETMWIGGIPLA